MSNEAKTILLADDEADVRVFVRTALEQYGFNFIEAKDGMEAQIMAREDKPDLMILDVGMPEKDGFLVFSHLRGDEETKGIPIIMLTGVAEDTGVDFDAEDVDEFLGSKPEAFLDKPVDAEKLQETVLNVLGMAGQ